GELQDAGTGVVAFGSRSYDAASGSWMAPDAWPGLLVQPQSLNRYAYVLGDPVTFVDVGGFAASTPNASAAANHYDYSGSAWKPILNPPSKASVPNISGAANHYDWNGTGWRAVLTPELESMREARHPDSARTCTSSSATPGCYPDGFRDMDFWKQHTSDIGDRVESSWKRMTDGFEIPYGVSSIAGGCALVCLGVDSNSNLVFGVGVVVGGGSSVGLSAVQPNQSALNVTCSVGGVYFGFAVSTSPFLSGLTGVVDGIKVGCSGGITIHFVSQ
ncbi:RHS repeat-associated core domain-containing protein, partial [Leucobacter sp. UT-8R-CII-1-4]|uniref:RHS repeat-associated core domain-containing protein n=1 Tax=Leucobacter sp. UT-8R-CII-1-4 TaxID=3040075 RepID=UPI0024A82B61